MAQKLSAQLCDYIVHALRGYNETQLSSELAPHTLYERPCDAIFTLTAISAYSAFRAQPRINLWLIGQMRDELTDRLFTPTSVPLPPFACQCFVLFFSCIISISQTLCSRDSLPFFCDWFLWPSISEMMYCMQYKHGPHAQCGAAVVWTHAALMWWVGITTYVKK